MVELTRKHDEAVREREQLQKRAEERRALDEATAAAAQTDEITALREKMSKFYSELTNQLQAEVEQEKKARQAAEAQVALVNSNATAQKLALEKVRGVQFFVCIF